LKFAINSDLIGKGIDAYEKRLDGIVVCIYI